MNTVNRSFIKFFGFRKCMFLQRSATTMVLRKFLPASYCFTNMIKDTCDSNPNLDKFGEDYITAMKRPCSNNETS
ncbi:hypothetical protein NQ317_016123 [Molorchus minor]|uniref:Uncharacterized protein n=1 Tax=Molorchus minor TaxID=1323400 RepID=A0ABQ9ITC7_9CUCU|nr:hypothetical protein NQ317_016123 [Molorchus minor]